jgi:predicted RNase H-like nuclease (RuvC/YqgF family)
MSILKILSGIDKATQAVDKVTQAVDKISAMGGAKPAPPKRALTIEEREKMVRVRIKEKGLQAVFRDIYPDL